MNPKTAAKWVEAHAWAQKAKGIPPILAQEAAKRAGTALRKAKPYKPRVRVPSGQKRESSLPALKRRAWVVFSRWIRQRDADENGYARCCTCQEVCHWKGMDAGHFESRIKENTLFDEQNVHAQCKGCNMPPNNGRRIEYAAFLDEKYGPGTAKAVSGRAYRRKLERQELYEIIAKYSERAALGEGLPRTVPHPQSQPVTPKLPQEQP